jgi:dTDP-4-amino-4,6-dideoxygalactose transaminase
MISANFAPNESGTDAWVSLKMLLFPWRWKKGKYQQLVKKKLEAYFPGNEVFLFLTGRSALYHLLKSLSLPDDTKVLVQAFTCEAVVLPIIANKLKPVYVDIEDKTYSMSASDLIEKYTGQAKVLVLQHTFGLVPKDRGLILDWAKKNNLFVIEDLAHGFNHSIIKDRSSSIAYLLSFGRSKALSSVFGGGVVTADSSIKEKLRETEKNLIPPSDTFIGRSLLYKPFSMLIKSTYDYYLGRIIHKLVQTFKILPPEITAKEKRGEFDDLLNRSFPNALACLLYHQLKKFDQMQAMRTSICEIYNGVISENLRINHLPMLRYPILTDDREKLLAEAKKKNVFLGQWYNQAVAPKEMDLDKVGYVMGSCPKAEEVCRKIVNLPTLIDKKQALNIVKIIR